MLLTPLHGIRVHRTQDRIVGCSVCWKRLKVGEILVEMSVVWSQREKPGRAAGRPMHVGSSPASACSSPWGGRCWSGRLEVAGQGSVELWVSGDPLWCDQPAGLEQSFSSMNVSEFLSSSGRLKDGSNSSESHPKG